MTNSTASTSKVKASNKPPTACEYCSMSFKKLEHLQRHMRIHTQDRPYSCVAPGCGKAFARQDTLNRHARLHTRKKDGEEPTHGRARRRTKSVSESSTASTRRTSTSPYPNATQREQDSNGSAHLPAPTLVHGFHVLSPSIPEHAAAQAYMPMSMPLTAASSKFSTMDLLGISYPDSDAASPNSDFSPLPSLNELYGAQSLDGATMFEKHLSRHHGMFQPRGLVQQPSSAIHQTHQLDFASPTASAASPWSDDGLSIGSNEFGRTPSLIHSSGLSSMSSSYDTTFMDRSPMLGSLPQLNRPFGSFCEEPQAMSPSYEGKMPGTDAYCSTDLMLQQLFQAADLQQIGSPMTSSSMSVASPQTNSNPMSPPYNSLGLLAGYNTQSQPESLRPKPMPTHTHSSSAPAYPISAPPFSSQTSSWPAPAHATQFMAHSNRDAPKFLSASVISQFAHHLVGVAPSSISPASQPSPAHNTFGLDNMHSPGLNTGKMSQSFPTNNNSLYPMLPFEHSGKTPAAQDLSWLTDSSVLDLPDWMRDS